MDLVNVLFQAFDGVFILSLTRLMHSNFRSDLRLKGEESSNLLVYNSLQRLHERQISLVGHRYHVWLHLNHAFVHVIDLALHSLRNRMSRLNHLSHERLEVIHTYEIVSLIAPFMELPSLHVTQPIHFLFIYWLFDRRGWFLCFDKQRSSRQPLLVRFEMINFD